MGARWWRLGWIPVYMSADEVDRWNSGYFEQTTEGIQCAIPIRNGSLPDTWYGTIGEAVQRGLLTEADVASLEDYDIAPQYS